MEPEGRASNDPHGKMSKRKSYDPSFKLKAEAVAEGRSKEAASPLYLYELDEVSERILYYIDEFEELELEFNSQKISG